jgi:type IX secretion system PorP/SprF family membrane protein
MKIKAVVIVFVGFIGQCFAQQEPLFTMYWNNYSLQNPAATGLFNKHFASVSARRQWVDFPGEPQVISAVYDYRLTKINSGIGINYFNDQLGLEKNNKINLNYSYHISFKKGGVLSTGIGVGVLQKTIDYSSFVFPTLTPDPLFPNSKETDNMLNINVGAMYKTNRFLLGFSSTQVNEAKSKKLNFKNSRHYFLTSSCKIALGRSFELKPSFYLRSDLSTTQADINVISMYKERFWLGLSYRSSDAVAAMAGVDIKGKYRIGYSYDYTTSKLRNYSSGSHEIILTLMLDGKTVNAEKQSE